MEAKSVAASKPAGARPHPPQAKSRKGDAMRFAQYTSKWAVVQQVTTGAGMPTN
ncbi:hypothetical protein GCM10010260_83140 [Streptomyces filipinensis]|uniref:Uncharacterized protein n=1 Tax=Streptomyces filipinensis TaxID=66887 RepID=A0A918IK82_9ACTN|nr:hypothetical protein GCM10010260_83140 [Streptomyces filipinensis]